ncbi:hypothetical protein PLESTB_001178700 [Pleodorina starrii]|uniref:DNA replication licensing factor MCM5 n=1 Tax=Pleodorina starrii TaxID=330485 RepID=A0A9W6BRU1_9CHLO|nr:hypothetical protein PLESTM_000254600 [Pleodorina starrii]GLC57062.1 hypothetical protein PLESTB_001178700 [Pleodorina starrii]GLC64895.1 hypothetical protein PLESTF_000219000 [Pleodorina starrii]
MSGFDGGRVYYSYQGQEAPREAPEDGAGVSDKELIDHFKKFIQTYQIGTTKDVSERRLYADDLYEHRTHLHVDLKDVRAASHRLADELEERPTEVLPLFEEAAYQVLQDMVAADENGKPVEGQDVQILLYSSIPLAQSQTMSIRDLESSRVSKLVLLTGIITAASKPRHKATYLTIQCKTCRGTKRVGCKPGLGGAFLPTYCDMADRRAPGAAGGEGCGPQPFTVISEGSTFVDQQTLKLQEKPEDVPTGELPRTVMLVADRQCCSIVTPGTRVTITGIYSTYKGKAMDKGATSLQQPYIRVVSIMQEAGDAHSSFKFTKEEIQAFEQFAKQDGLLDEIFARIAPNIYGSPDIKRAIACLLFGGSRKSLPDGTNRRGDINVLLLGDPSTAKSQFLKFVSRVAPIAVYTSGKGSSAAGLTASVVQDANSREFYLEGGAMVLADNGVVCIDEFDKMRPEDRVAIHEAMEQQTISIAKAGITTMLKSRTSVLAAANPPSGRYDDLKTAQENIDLQSTILSRFDLIFIVKDVREHDIAIARQVLDNHRLGGAMKARRQGAGAGGSAGADAGGQEAQDVEFLKRYIHYCRSQCSPRVNEDAAKRLAAFYVEIRNEARAQANATDSDSPPVPITVRQLEAVVRIAESLAKMALQPVATLEHVNMSIELFTKSTMDAVKSGLTQTELGGEQQLGHVRRLEERIKRRLHIGAYMTTRRLLDEMVALGEPESLVLRVLLTLAAAGDVNLTRERTMVHRVR